MAAFDHRCMRALRTGQHNRGPWRPEEDDRLTVLYRLKDGNWTKIAPLMPTHRTPKQCRERWHQNLKPDLAHTPLTEQEQVRVMHLVLERGHKWASIARSLGPHRSDNMVKNWWNGENNRRSRTKAKKRVSVGGDSGYLRDRIDQRRLPPPIPQMVQHRRSHEVETFPHTIPYDQPWIGNLWSQPTLSQGSFVPYEDYIGESLRPTMPSPVNSQSSNTAPSLVADCASTSPQPQQIETPRVSELVLPSIPPSESRDPRGTLSHVPSASAGQISRNLYPLSQPPYVYGHVRHTSPENGNPLPTPGIKSPKDKMRVVDILN